MTSDKGILIKNIYYMLSYAFQILKRDDYMEMAGEDFREAQNMFAAILAKGVGEQLKKGLYREYVPRQETLPVLRGKLELPETIRCRMQKKQLLACRFDELSEDNLYNQILKTAMEALVRTEGVDLSRKAALKKHLLFFGGVQLLAPNDIPWNRLQYRRGNASYEMLLNLCYFLLDGMLHTTEKGGYRLSTFSDEHMERLYERFILEYYRRHHTYLDEASAATIDWDLDIQQDSSMCRYLPSMRTDVTLRHGDKTLIIDAKYYGKILSQHFDKASFRSGHLYQIFAYVKNADHGNTGSVSGILLYAKTGETIQPERCTYEIGGNSIGIRTLDLNTDFQVIAAQLDRIAEEAFGPQPIAAY